ncbi:arginase family protein, partial [Acidobacteriota bacterium]
MNDKLQFPSIPFNFCGLEEEYSAFDTSKAVILPVPFETDHGQSGASLAPWHIIAASKDAELYDMELGCEIHTHGIYTHGALELDRSTLESPLDNIKACVADLLGMNKYPVIIGGDRTVTLGAVKACQSLNENLMTVVVAGRADRISMSKSVHC